MATKKTEVEKKTVEDKKPKEVEEDDDRVTIMIPYIEGESPEVTVWVNDEITQIKRGHQVRVKRNVAEVLENSYQMTLVAMENKKQLKNQHQDW